MYINSQTLEPIFILVFNPITQFCTLLAWRHVVNAIAASRRLNSIKVMGYHQTEVVGCGRGPFCCYCYRFWFFGCCCCCYCWAHVHYMQVCVGGTFRTSNVHSRALTVKRNGQRCYCCKRAHAVIIQRSHTLSLLVHMIIALYGNFWENAKAFARCASVRECVHSSLVSRMAWQDSNLWYVIRTRIFFCGKIP